MSNKNTQAEDMAKIIIDDLFDAVTTNRGGASTISAPHGGISTSHGGDEKQIVVKFSDNSTLILNGIATKGPTLPTCPPIPDEDLSEHSEDD